MNRSKCRFPRINNFSELEDTLELNPPKSKRRTEALRQKEDPRAGRNLRRCIGAILGTVFLGILLGTVAARWTKVPEGRDLRLPSLLPQAVRPFQGKQIVSILIMGTDDEAEDGRSDTIMLVTLSPSRGRAALVSIPRDSRVAIPGHGVDRINVAYREGAAALACTTAEELVGRKIDYYVRTDFSGFQKIIDAMGGVTIDVEKRMVYRDSAQNLYINLHPGRRRLNGHEAMCYVRFRHDALGDIGRIHRQQKFVRAVAEQMTRPAMLPRLPFVLKRVSESVTTNLRPRDLYALANMVRKMNGKSLATETLPGRPIYIGGKSYWEVERYRTAELLADLDVTLLHPESIARKEKQPPSVVVLNGCGVPGVAQRVARHLSGVGFKVRHTGNADNFRYRSSQIMYHSENTDVGVRIQRIIGCGVVVPASEADAPEADVTVILGKDFARA